MIVLKAKILLNIGKYDESKEYFQKSVRNVEEEENRNGLAKIYLTISDIYKNIGDNEKVLEYSHKVYNIKQNDEDEYTSNSLFSIIEAYIKNKEFELS